MVNFIIAVRDRFLHCQGEKWHEGILNVGLMSVRTNDLLSRAKYGNKSDVDQPSQDRKTR